jgi:hypothetical protein
MDLFDVLNAFPVGSARRRPWREELAITIAYWVLPMAEVTLILATGLYQHPYAASTLLPAACATVTYLVCRGLNLGTGFAVRTSIFSALLCFLVAVPALMVAAFFGAF